MIKLALQDLIKLDNAELVQGNSEIEIQDISIDTRTIKPGEVFFAIEKGNDYLEMAIQNGAIACVVEKELDPVFLEMYPDITFVKTQNSVTALQKLAKYKREQYNIPVIAITGSVGKTSSKDVISNVVKQKYNVLKTEGNLNNHIGLPLTILKLKNHEALVVEMGMNHLGEIETLSSIAKPTIAVITNVGTSHIGILGSRENILKAKLEIISGLHENGTLIINVDNDLLNKWNTKTKRKNTTTYSIEKHSNYQAFNITTTENDSQYNIKIDNNEYLVNVPVSGIHFVYNSLAAIAVGKALGIDDEKILTGIKTFELTKKRMELQEVNGIKIINDVYNASYESMKYALEYLNTISGNRKIAVLGDIFELGDFAEELHKKVGMEVNNNNVDILITVGGNAEFIANTATKVKEKYIFKNVQQAVEPIEKLFNYIGVEIGKAQGMACVGTFASGIALALGVIALTEIHRLKKSKE